MKKISGHSTSPAISDKPSSECVKAKHQPATPLPWKTNQDHADILYSTHAANAYPKLVEALQILSSGSYSALEAPRIAAQALRDIGEPAPEVL